MSPNIENSHKTIPSYLSRFLKDEIYLMYKEGNEESTEYMPKFLKSSSEDENELTGNPLQVDLGNDTSIQLETEHIPRWSLQELKHLPFEILDARQALQKSIHDSTTFIITDGADNKKTVLLGVDKKKLSSYSIHDKGEVALNEVDSAIDGFVQDHLNSCAPGNSKIDFSIKQTYKLYGCSLSNVPEEKLRHMSTDGCIFIDVISNEKKFTLDRNKINFMTMQLELVAGHKLLKLRDWFEKLCQLQDLIQIMGDSDFCEETRISLTPLSSDVLLNMITSAVALKSLRVEKESAAGDWKHLRPDDLLDSLWEILRQSEDVSTLRDSLVAFFETVAVETVGPMEQDSKMATIVKGVSQGKMSVPTISFTDSVVVLFELGARKLKNDFKCMLKQFYNMDYSVDANWGKLQDFNSNFIKTGRGSRATRLISHFDVNVLSRQLAYLSQLYVGCEFLSLVKDMISMSEDTFKQFCLQIDEKYVSNTSKISEFDLILTSPLVKLSFDLDPNNACMLEGAPNRWTMSIKTGNKKTVYDLSDEPVFPPNILDYDLKSGKHNDFKDTSDTNVYFVTKMSCNEGLF